MDEVIRIVCEYYTISPESIVTKNRKDELVKARYICWYILRNKFLWSFDKIGKNFNKCHASVIHGVKEMEFRLQHYKKDEEELSEILSLLQISYVEKAKPAPMALEKYRELLLGVIKQDYKTFLKLGFNLETRIWIYNDMNLSKEIINKIESYAEEQIKGRKG